MSHILRVFVHHSLRREGRIRQASYDRAKKAATLALESSYQQMSAVYRDSESHLQRLQSIRNDR